MKLRDIISLSFTGILVTCALVITFLIIRQQLFTDSPDIVIREVQNWKELKLNGWRTGPEDAPVQIIEFFDYQCPFCKKSQSVIQTIKKKYGDTVSINYEHFPLEGHKYAFSAALASECARNQGAFLNLHNQLFANQERLGIISFDSLANYVLYDTIAFTKCLEDQETAGTVYAGKQFGVALGISSIPTFVINGSIVSGALTQKQLEQLIQEKLDANN